MRFFNMMNSKRSQNNSAQQTPETIWSRPFIFLNLSFFMAFSNIAFLYLYPLALDTMGFAHHLVGLVLGTFSAAAVLSRPFLGQLIVKKGEAVVFSLGMIASVTASLSYTLIKEFGPAILFIRLLHGFGFSAYISAGFSLAAKTVHPNQRGESFSIIGVSLMGAIAFAPYFGEILIQKWGFTALYIAASAACFLAWLTALKATPAIALTPACRKKTPVTYRTLLRNNSFVFLLVSTLIFSHCQATVPNFIALISSEKGVSSGRFFLISNIVAILVLLLTGKMIDRFGKLFFMKISYPIFALGMLLIPGMISGALHGVPAVLCGIGTAILFSTHNALAASHGSKVEKPAIMSLFTAVYDTGFVTGAIASGWFAYLAGLDTLFWACGALGLLGLLAVIMLPIRER